MSAGQYIWQGLKPTLKMVLTIGCGYILTRKGLFPPAASKGLSQVAMNIGLPCLLFSSMVPSFNDSNIQNFGPLSLIAFLFIGIGATMFLVLRELFYVPADFQWGFIMLGAMSNWGNLPIAVVQSVGTEAPFNPATDQELGIAYIAVFILIMNASFYGLGTYRICGWDLRDDRPEIPRTFAGRIARRKRQFASLLRWFSKRKHNLHLKRPEGELPQRTVNEIEEGAASGTIANHPDVVPQGTRGNLRAGVTVPFPSIERTPSSHANVESLAWEEDDIRPLPSHSRTRSISSVSHHRNAGPRSASHQRAESIREEDDLIQTEGAMASDSEKFTPGGGAKEEKDETERANTSVSASVDIQEQAAVSQGRPTILRSIWNATRPLLTPATLGVIVSIPISLVQPLKALFVEVPGWTGAAIGNAPDGKPPLAFFFDFTEFVGGMTVPGGLIILGASFARIKISRARLKEMPIRALIASTVAKLALAPLIGILVVSGLQDNTSLFPKSEKMLSFCAFLLSGTPSAINQLVATQIFAREGQSLDTVSTFLLAQYALLIVQSAALTAISLWLST